MALTAAGLELSRIHYEVQKDERARTLLELSGFWRLFDPFDFVTFEGFEEVATHLLDEAWSRSALLADQYYENLRIAEGIVGSAFDVENAPLVRPPERVEIANQLRAAGISGVVAARRAGKSAQAAKDNAFVKVAGTATRIQLSGARDTIIAKAMADPAHPLFWRRTSANPCAFCRMLSARGLYRDADFKTHDHCSCYPEVAFSGDEAPAQVQRWQREYAAATRGLSGREAQIAFRQQVEGRGISWPAVGHLPRPMQRAIAEGEAASDKLRKVEHFRAYTADGSLVFDKGPDDGGQTNLPTAYGIEFTDAEVAELRRIGDEAQAKGEPFVYTHNHPGGYDFTEPGDPRAAGNAFSMQDWIFAADINASEFRAISPSYVFSVQRPATGWRVMGDGGLSHRLQYHNTIVRSEGMTRLNAAPYGSPEQQEIIRELEAEHWHKVAEGVAKDIGATYTRTPRETTK